MNLANFGQSVRFQALQTQPQRYVYFFFIFFFVSPALLSVVTAPATALRYFYQDSNSFLLSNMASVDSLFACELLEIRLSTVIVHCVET